MNDRLVLAVLVGAMCVALVVVVVWAYRPTSGYRRAVRWAERTGLPFEPSSLRRSIVARFRLTEIAEGWAGIATGAVSLAFLATPVGASPLYVLIVVLPTFLVSRLIAACVVSLRERLFHPAPDAPRVARIRTMRTSDYLGPVRRAVTWILAAAAGGFVVALVVVGSSGVRNTAAWISAAAALTCALSACAVLPLLERAVLRTPQPASDTVELAWDDALRADALVNIRLSVAVACVLGIALAVSALWDVGADKFLPSQIVIWGQLALQIAFPPNGLALRPALRPQAAVTA